MTTVTFFRSDELRWAFWGGLSFYSHGDWLTYTKEGGRHPLTWHPGQGEDDLDELP